MLLVVLALAWVALLAPVAIRKLRELNADRSIEHFHTEHEVLSRQGYVVEPAYRLSDTRYEREAQYASEAQYEREAQYASERERARGVARDEQAQRARLTLVREDDTYRSVESRRTWAEWSEDYDFERNEPAVRESANRYVSAYSSMPRGYEMDRVEEPLRPIRSMRRRRRVMVTRLALATVLVSTAAFFSGVSVLFDLAVLTWLLDAAYLALALFALSQGYLGEASVGLGRRERYAPVSRIEGAYAYEDDEQRRGFGPGTYADEQYYDEPPETEWANATQARYALG